MFRLPFYIAVTLLIAFGGGIGATLLALEATTAFGTIRIGSWQAHPLAQTLEADPYTKSHRANGGQLLYGIAEGLTFRADVDDKGERLQAQCNYALSGTMPPSRFWTIFVANGDQRLAGDNESRPVALNSRIVLRNSDGNLNIAISQNAKPMNWLATPDSGAFSLILTLLDTPVAGSAGLVDITMPVISKIGCTNA